MRGKPGLTGERRTRYFNTLGQVARLFDQIAPRDSGVREFSRECDGSIVCAESYPLISLGSMGTELTMYVRPRERRVITSEDDYSCRQELSLDFIRLDPVDAEDAVANLDYYSTGTLAVHHGCDVTPTSSRYNELRAMRDALAFVTGAVAVRQVDINMTLCYGRKHVPVN